MQRIIGPVRVGLVVLSLIGCLRAQVTPRDVEPSRLFASAETRPSTDVRIGEFGKSAAGTPLRSVLVALPGAVEPQKRPRLLVVAGLNPDAAGSMLVASRLPAAFLDHASTDAKLKELLTRVAIEVIPCVAVDAVTEAAKGSLRERRGNLRPVDDDRDGVTDEDGPDDLDGDGIITQMRVRDPLGEWRTSPDDPRLLVRADRKKGEIGEFRLESEGQDDDGDGVLNEDGPGGVDFDRNFPHGWKEFDRAAGITPISEPETRALIRHVLDHHEIVAVLVLGHRDNLVETPPAAKGGGQVPNGIEEDDRPVFEEASASFKKLLGFEKKQDDKPDGALHQWAYFQFGVPAFAAKVFEAPKPEQAASLPSGKKPESDETRRLVDSDVRLSGKGFVAWKPFKHPTLGDVEIGGFVPLSDVNPTADRLDDLAKRHASFILDLAAQFPRVVLLEPKIRALGAGLHEVTVVVRNDGRWPTVFRIATRTRTVLPSRLTLDLPPDRFEAGDPRTMLEPLAGSGGGRKLRWVVRARAGEEIRIALWSEKAGAAQATLVAAEDPK